MIIKVFINTMKNDILKTDCWKEQHPERNSLNFQENFFSFRY